MYRSSSVLDGCWIDETTKEIEMTKAVVAAAAACQSVGPASSSIIQD